MFKILAIDDDKNSLIIQHVYIRQAFPDAVFHTAQNGAGGLEKAKEHDPDVILLDIMMPGLNGFDVCRNLKQEALTRHIPILFITSASGDKELKMKALDAGGDGFLLKPFDEIQLMAQIKTMAKLKKYNLNAVAVNHRVKEQPGEPGLKVCNPVIPESMLKPENTPVQAGKGKMNLQNAGLPEDNPWISATAHVCSSLTFCTSANVASLILEALALSAKILGAANVTMYRSKGLNASFAVHSWQAPGYNQVRGIQNIVPSEGIWDMEQFRNNKGIIIKKKEDISGDSWKIKEWLNSCRHLFPMAGIPLHNGNRLLGYLEFCSVRNTGKIHKYQVECLMAIAKSISGACASVELQRNQQEAIEKAEENDRLKSAFLADMSHEIRTPLNGLIGFVDLLQQPGLSSEDQELFSAMIKKSSNRLLTIISNMIEISKIESGQVPLVPAPQSMDELMQVLRTICKQVADEKGIVILSSTFSPTEGNHTFITDKNKLQAILKNLIEITAHYVNDDMIYLNHSRSDNKITFIIEYSGKSRLPDPSFLGNLTQNQHNEYEPYHEMELELIVTKAYADMLNGQIWLETDHSGVQRLCFSVNDIQL